MDGCGHLFPAQKYLLFPGQIGPAPQAKHIIPGTVTHTLTVLQYLLHIGVVEERLNKIAAFFAVLMGGKKCGDFNSMIF